MDKKKEDRFVELLMKTGIQKNIARAFAFIAGREETTSRNIEDNTRLRQPEVSIATNKLRSTGWIDKRDIKKEGKGRPVHGYSLKKPIDDIIAEIEEKEKGKVKDIQDNLKKLKKLTSTL
ncbi:MAG: ArsR family transcriptional regulator [Thermoplasmata archaeon]